MSDAPRVALVETSEALPGLLPFQAWDALGTADEVLLRDPAAHPSAAHLWHAGLDLTEVEPAALGRGDLDLTRPGAPDDRRIAKALVERALAGERVVYLLGPADDGLAPALAGMAAEHDLEIELVFLAQQPQGTEVLRTVEVVRALRDPDHGCPWDLEQDHDSLVHHLVEETYELVDAIEQGDDGELREELGDVLLQVLLHARVAADRGAFGIDDVARDLATKLVHRHPHVFGEGDASTPEQVQANWDQLKASEKDRDGVFAGVADAAPGLQLLGELQRKAAKHGYAWGGGAVTGAVRRHLEAAIDDAAGEDPLTVIGEVLAAVVATARSHDVDPEAAARAAARRFRAGFESAYAEVVSAGGDPTAVETAEWERRLGGAGVGGDRQ